MIKSVRVDPALRATCREALDGWGPGARLRAPGGGPGGESPGSSWVFALF